MAADAEIARKQEAEQRRLADERREQQDRNLRVALNEETRIHQETQSKQMAEIHAMLSGQLKGKLIGLNTAGAPESARHTEASVLASLQISDGAILVEVKPPDPTTPEYRARILTALHRLCLTVTVAAPISFFSQTLFEICFSMPVRTARAVFDSAFLLTTMQIRTEVCVYVIVFALFDRLLVLTSAAFVFVFGYALVAHGRDGRHGAHVACISLMHFLFKSHEYDLLSHDLCFPIMCVQGANGHAPGQAGRSGQPGSMA